MRARAAVACGVVASTLALLIGTARGLGYARDEGFYFHAARVYQEWFGLLASDRAEAMKRTVVDAHFGVNHEHPVLMKSLFALSNLILEKKLDLFEEPGTSFRFPAMALAALFVGGIYLWGSKRHGHVVGLVAAASFLFMPRVFYQAHLACFDIPIAALFFFTLHAYARAIEEEGRAWPAITGLVFGLALATKHNAWFLPFVVAGHAGLLGAWALRSRGSVWAAVRPSVRPMVAMGVIGPLVAFALWPWIWHDTVHRVRDYVAFHTGHEFYNMEFLGRNYFEPPMPRSYAWLMTVATVPTVTLFAAGIGAAHAAWATAPAWFSAPRRASQDDDRGPAPGADVSTPLLWITAIAISFAPWLSTDTPIFGGTKHWMTAYPFLALFAGEGVAWSLRTIGRTSSSRAYTTVGATTVALLAIAAPIREALHAHPWGLTAYTPLVGGAPGAATLGLNRGFWGYTTGSLAEYLNREVPKGGRVYVHDTAWPAWRMLQEDGRVRGDIAAVSTAADAEFAIYHHEKHMQGQEYQAWVAYGTVRPDFVLGLDGVPVVWVYRRTGSVHARR